ncbi:MAG: hypothetical protein E6J34_22425 [Chloroflexi bacterium]|nr:MAG: hypothetical protein E6J34_22425 [Chloroflexota bacterium]
MANLPNQEPLVESQSFYHKVFKWKEKHTKYCYESDGYLSFSSDGTGYWRCYTWTDDHESDHVWYCNFSCYSHSGEHLFDTDQCESPPMSYGKKYKWHFDFEYDPSYYDKISKVTQYYNC